MSFRAKLLLLCLILTSFSVVVAINNRSSIKEVVNISAPIGTETIPKIEKISAMQGEFRELRIQVRSLAIFGLKVDQIATLETRARASIEAINKARNEYDALPLNDNEKYLLAEFDKRFNLFLSESSHLFEAARSGSPADNLTLREFFLNRCPVLAAQVYEIVGQMVTYEKNDSTKRVTLAASVGQKSADTALYLLITAIITGLFGGLIGSSYLANSLMNVVRKISDGLTSNSQDVDSISSELKKTAARVSNASTESASALEETVASLEELSSMVKVNTDNTSIAESLSEECRAAAESGEKQMKILGSAMSNISSSSKKIDEIIGVIDIAFQTNLLALNAAVEAARAGEHGKGFAVVAEAVRNLAQRSATAAKDISSIIKESQQVVTEGEELSIDMTQAFHSISSSVSKLRNLMRDISGASKEQSNGLQQINLAMNSLDRTTQGNALTAQNLVESATKLASSTNELVENIERLNQSVGGAQISQSKTPEASSPLMGGTLGMGN